MKNLLKLLYCTLLISLVGCVVEYTHESKPVHKMKYKSYMVDHDSRTKRTPDTH